MINQHKNIIIAIIPGRYNYYYKECCLHKCNEKKFLVFVVNLRNILLPICRENLALLENFK